MEFSRPEYWSGELFPPPGNLPNPGIEPGLPHCRQILYQLSHRGKPTESIKGKYTHTKAEEQYNHHATEELKCYKEWKTPAHPFMTAPLHPLPQAITIQSVMIIIPMNRALFLLSM